MPKLIDKDSCPHCGKALPDPKPRICPECMGSIQQRHLALGCVSSGPALVLLGLGLHWLIQRPW
ncbi:MAG: putative amidophosphoribosyltransferase [Chlamydiales bacterium]|jgi:predicted amidophosphoribosyltransferase